jgi:hypothetical protein
MKIRPSALAWASLTLGTAPLGAQTVDEPLRLASSSDWVLDYAEDSCALRRAFAAGDHQAILELRQYGPGDQLEVLIVSDTLSRTRRAPRARFEPDEAWLEPFAANFVDAGTTRGLIYTDSLRPAALKPKTEAWPAWPDADRNAREQAVTGLTIADSFERDVTLLTGMMHQPMEAMRTCLAELVTHWGLDPVAQGPLARGATPVGIDNWSRRTLQNYPSDMLRAGKSGRVPVRLIVGKDGRPKSCHPAGFAERSFLEAACSSLMRYARFQPALDGNGEPVTGTYVSTIVYQAF